ncbi:tetratricopeptide repeat protein, partial [bacterium]|nr:tetratricopeptide repeat protein [bacterium]
MRLNLLCLLLTLPFYASASNIDDLKSTLATTTSDTAKIGLIVSYKTEIGGNDSILKLLGKAKALTKDNNNYRLYDVWRKRAIILWDNKTDSAEMLLKAAIKEADIQNKPLKVGELYYLMCRLKSRGFEFKKARKYGLEAANYFKKRSAKMLLKTCNIVSRAFYYDGNIDSAKIYFQKALVLAYKLNDSMYLSQQLMNMGVIHDVNGASDSALFYYEKAVAVADRIEDKYISAQTHLNLGTFYQERNSLTNAIEEFQVATALFESTNDYENLANNYENIAATYLSMHNLPSSWEYLKKAQKLIKTHHLAFIEPTHYKSLCSYYSQDDNTDSVIKYSLLAAEEFMTVNRICDASTYYYNYIENLELQHKQQLPTDILAKLDTLDQNCDELTKNT